LRWVVYETSEWGKLERIGERERVFLRRVRVRVRVFQSLLVTMTMRTSLFFFVLFLSVVVLLHGTNAAAFMVTDPNDSLSGFTLRDAINLAAPVITFGKCFFFFLLLLLLLLLGFPGFVFRLLSYRRLVFNSSTRHLVKQ